MKTKNLIILSVWLAVTIIFVSLMFLGASYSDNPTQWLIWMFDDWWIVFVITLVFTGVVSFFVKEEGNLQSNLHNIDSKLDLLAKEIAEIKKAIDE
jgi:hypothetical protein